MELTNWWLSNLFDNFLLLLNGFWPYSQKRTIAVFMYNLFETISFIWDKKDCRDRLLLRYGWPIPGVYSSCACGQKNSEPCTVLQKRGYASFHHNVLMETKAEFLKEARRRNVYTEPALLPTRAKLHPKGAVTSDGAYLDIVATGLYGRMRRCSWMCQSPMPEPPLILHSQSKSCNEEMKKIRKQSPQF